MSGSIANHTALHYPIFFASPLRRPSKASALSFSPLPIHKYPILRSIPKVAVSQPQEADEDNVIFGNETEKENGQNDLTTLETLMIAYKTAILDGDDKNVEKIEEAICKINAEKNALALNLEEMIAEIASGKDKLLRIKADFENRRKQTENDRHMFTSDVQGELLELLLPMVDSFERIKKEIVPQTEKEKKIETSYQGIYKQFVEVMRSLGVAVVETVGKPFDPSIHEAVAREESQKYQAGIVSLEISRGFVQGKRILRTAKVEVSTGLRAAPADNPTEKQKLTDESVENAEPMTSES